MSKNRVERLESTVVELESTVEGLTEELVEAKERIRVLEAALDAETPTRAPDRRETNAGYASATDANVEPDDVAVAAAEAHKADEHERGNEEESGVDDIIVA